MSTWYLTEDRFVPHLHPWKESLFSTGNGYLGTRGSFEEPFSDETRCTFINGVYVTPPGELPLLGAVPDWTRFELLLDGEPVTLDAPIAGYERRLDLQTGELYRAFLWKGAHTGTYRVEFRRFLSMALPGLAVGRVKVDALTDAGDVVVTTGIDGGVPSPDEPAFTVVETGRLDHDVIGLRCRSIDDAHEISVTARVVTDRTTTFINDPTHPRFRTEGDVRAGESLVVTKLVGYAQRGAEVAGSTPPVDSYERLLSESTKAWAERWKTSRIDIGGDDTAERAVRFAAHQTIAAAPSQNSTGALGAKLLSGFGYRHHVFWDADIYSIPYLTVTQPDLARLHFAYRYRGLEGARRKAAEYGRKGAFYAWESADSGDEVTPKWGYPPDGQPVRIWTGELEEHIVADVAYAVQQYAAWTGDEGFMADEGLEIILDTAAYWASRLEVEDDGAHLRNVIGPDEYHIHVDDSFFTNALVRHHLHLGADHLDTMATELRDRLMSTLQLGADTADRWRTLADQVVLRRVADVWEQHEGFFELERVDLSAFEPRQTAVYDLLGEKRMQRTAVIKQADVLLAMALLGEEVGDAATSLANWDFYEPMCDHGSSLSRPGHAWAAARLGMVEAAYHHFRKALEIDFEDLNGNGRDGIHAATQGGILQAVVFGFAGISHDGQQVSATPQLPPHWTSLGLSVVHKGRRYEFEL